MVIYYDRVNDTLNIGLAMNEVRQSHEFTDVVVSTDQDGALVTIQVADASRRVDLSTITVEGLLAT